MHFFIYSYLDTAYNVMHDTWMIKVKRGHVMSYEVDFKNVETVGLEGLPLAKELAGLRANEARYFWNKYKFIYTTYPASEMQKEIAWLNKILLDEREIVFQAKVIEVAIYEDDKLYWPDFIFDNGMIINVLYEKNVEKPKRAVGIKLCEGMAAPDELQGKFKFAHQRSKLAGTIRGSYFNLHQDWL